MKRSSRAQAALEYLSTYGWAIIVVLAAIGALAYFGVLNPSQYLPSTFTMSDGLSAGEYKIDEQSLSFTVKNNYGYDIDMMGYNVTSVGGSVSCEFVFDYPAGHEVFVPSDETYTLTTTNCKGVKGERFKADIQLYYRKRGETVTHTVDGKIATRVEE